MTSEFKDAIELVWPENRVVPVPLIGGINLHHHFYEFLISRYYYPKDIKDNMKAVTGSSIRQIAYDLKAFFDGLAWHKISYLEADYTEHIEQMVELQLENAAPATYNTRLSRIREFYDYLRKQNIRFKARFPARTVKKIYQNQDDNPLSHTSFRNSKTIEKDDGHKKTTLKLDYKDDVISIKTYGKLYDSLKNIDPVYAVIAQVMMQTFLRIADICEMPLHTNAHNKNIPIWPEFDRLGADTLRYKCLTKGLKKVEIDIYPATLQAIYADYIEPCYQERKALFLSKYMARKNANLEFGNIRDKGRRSCPDDILWLTKTGTPVKPYMIEAAFREAGLNVHPHMLRHSGATHTLWNYCRIHGIEPDVRLASTFQQILQEQLGHADIETTRMYIRTLITLKGRKSMPFCIPTNKNQIDAQMSETIRKDIADMMASFFEVRSELVEIEIDETLEEIA